MSVGVAAEAFVVAPGAKSITISRVACFPT
jgi:hypothetical protein